MLRKGHPVLLQARLESVLAMAVLEAASTIVEGTRGRQSRSEKCGYGLNPRHSLRRSFVAIEC
jgi:hypothetical protein